MKATILGNDFNRIMDATKSFCRSGDPAQFGYIRLDFDAVALRVEAYACDGYRLSVEHSVIGTCDESFTVYLRGGIRLPGKQYATIELVGDEVQIRCNGALFGFEQPGNIEPFEWKNVTPKGDAHFRIGFNGNYLLDALQAAKISAGKTFRTPIVMEFWTPTSPMVIRTNHADIKMVLPMRLASE